MTIQVSPLLRNQLISAGKIKQDSNSQLSHHEKIYEDLKLHANDVKPNEPKARLVKQGPVGRTASAVSDTFKDGANFFKAVSTGKMNDNSLGRINDLGMKGGALLIATYLASHAKTKTEAIMQFVGGTTFFAAMSLWPKLFINLPARLVHGFPIDEKYISAQGDKKDLYLDNQFIPTKLHSEKQKLAEMKRMGIDPKEKNAEEKWHRKRQKTALQNRTLWMATAGFSTPLLTALIGNVVEPKVENAVIDHELKKANAILRDEGALDKYFAGKSEVRNEEQIKNLFGQYEGAKPDDNFFKRLAALLQVDDILGEFKNPDDAKPLNEMKSNHLIETLENLWEQTSTFDTDKLKETLRNTHITQSSDLVAKTRTPLLSIQQIEQAVKNLGDNLTAENLKEKLKTLKVSDSETMELTAEQIKQVLSKLKGKVTTTSLKSALKSLKDSSNVQASMLSPDKIDDIIRALGENKTIENLRNILAKKGGFATEQQKQIIASLQTDNKVFFERITDYNKNILSQIRGRLKAYLDLLNPVAGSKSESVTTREYNQTMQQTVKNLQMGGYKKLQEVKKGELKQTQAILADQVKALVEQDVDFANQYKAFLGLVEEFVASGKEDRNIFKNNLKAAFGDNFPLVKDEDLLNEFAWYIKKDDKTWPFQIFSQWCTPEGGGPIPESIKKLKLEGISKEAREAMEALSREETLGRISDVVSEDKSYMKSVVDATLGGKESGMSVFELLKKHIKNKRIDIDFSKAKALICANFERRVKEGLFESYGEDGLKAAKDFIYNGSISTRYNNAEFPNKEIAKDIVNTIFNAEAFAAEEEAMHGIQGIVSDLKNLINKENGQEQFGDFTSRTLKSASFTEQVKNYATRLYNNKSWLRKFAPMAIILVAVTLLIQPRFGKIEKEFPEDKKAGGAE